MTDPFSVREVLDRRSGKVHRFYDYKRKRCLRVELDSRLADHLAGYALIEKDLRSALNWLALIDSMHTTGPLPDGESFSHSADRNKFNHIKGLFVAALTFYGKCFSKCEGRPVKLERAQLDSKYRDLHDTCMKFRHNFAAHSGAEKLEAVTIALVMPQQRKKAQDSRVYVELRQPDLLWPTKPEVTLNELFSHVRLIAKTKSEHLTDKILVEEVYPKGPDYWKTR